MNNRFKELLNQCWDMRLDGRNIDQEMFAELIVRECAKTVEHINMQGGGNLGDIIKRKFGVDDEV